MQYAESILDLIGDTPLVKLNRMTDSRMATVLVKLENYNPAGSVKDRMAWNMVRRAEEAGLLAPGATLVESTSGNTGLGLAMTAAVRGYRCICTMPDKMSKEKIDMLKAYGAGGDHHPHRSPPRSPRELRGGRQAHRARDAGRLLHRPVLQHAQPRGPLPPRPVRRSGSRPTAGSTRWWAASAPAARSRERRST